MRLIEYHDTVLAHFLRNLICDFRIQQVVKRIDDDIGVCKLGDGVKQSWVSEFRPISKEGRFKKEGKIA